MVVSSHRLFFFFRVGPNGSSLPETGNDGGDPAVPHSRLSWGWTRGRTVSQDPEWYGLRPRGVSVLWPSLVLSSRSSTSVKGILLDLQ